MNFSQKALLHPLQTKSWRSIEGKTGLFMMFTEVAFCYSKTSPHLAFQFVFSLSVEVRYGWTVCKVDSIWDRM